MEFSLAEIQAVIEARDLTTKRRISAGGAGHTGAMAGASTRGRSATMSYFSRSPESATTGTHLSRPLSSGAQWQQ